MVCHMRDIKIIFLFCVFVLKNLVLIIISTLKKKIRCEMVRRSNETASKWELTYISTSNGTGRDYLPKSKTHYFFNVKPRKDF